MDDMQRGPLPTLLSEIADPPKKLYVKGTLPKEHAKKVCIIGSRKNTPYGKEVCETLISALKGKNVSIVSGLALGIDTIAHKAALRNNIHTVAIPGSGIDESALYPHTNIPLAHHILKKGGALLSEFEPTFQATKWSFPKRNRIMAGFSDVIVVIEATKKSGTLITAKLAIEYNREVCAIPGSIFSKNSEGPHTLIRDGATPIRSSYDLLDVLGFTDEKRKTILSHLSKDEIKIVALLEKHPCTKEKIAEYCHLSLSHTSITLSLMEIKGIIKEELGKIYLK